MGPLGDAADAVGCDSGLVRRPGHHPHTLSRTGAPDRRESSDLSARHDDVVGAGRQDRARLLHVWGFLRVHPLRGRYRSVLGALAGARVLEPGAVAPAGGGQARTRTGRHGRGLGVRICARGQDPHVGSVAAAGAAGLVFEIRAQDGRERGRSRLSRRHGEAVSDRARSGSVARVQRHAAESDRRGAEGESGDRGLGARARRGGVHGAGVGLPAIPR